LIQIILLIGYNLHTISGWMDKTKLSRNISTYLREIFLDTFVLNLYAFYEQDNKATYIPWMDE